MTWLTHNPAFLEPTQIIERFVVRGEELKTLLRVLRENDGDSNQHVLILAPRGRGKSMLVQRVAAELDRDPELGGRWFAIVFGEESYDISTPGELWLEAILHLADALDDPRWHEVHKRLHAEPDERRLAAATLGHLMDFADEVDKRLLLVVENLDRLFTVQLDEDQAWTLRKVLLAEPRLMLLGTAVRRFPGLEQPNEAMFELFRRVELPPLDERECQTLWSAVVGEPVPLERAAAMRVLTGGNPRLLVLLASFSEGRDLRALVDDLMLLIDQHTDYFKHNIEALSNQQARVFLALARLWAPATAAQVAAEARMDVNKVSVQLGRLEQDGRIELVEVRGRKKVYQVSERLYNIYHLMRKRGGVESRVRWFLEFMRLFYQSEELPGVLGRLAAEACGLEPSLRREHLFLIDSFIEEHAEDTSELVQILSRVPTQFMEPPDLPSSVQKSLLAPSVLLAQPQKDHRWWRLVGHCLAHSPEVFLTFANHPTIGELAVESLREARPVGEPQRLLTIAFALWAGHVDEILELIPTSGTNNVLADILVAVSHLHPTHEEPLLRRAHLLAPDSPFVSVSLGAKLLTDPKTHEDGMVLLQEAESTVSDEIAFWSLPMRRISQSAEPTLARKYLDAALAAWPFDDSLIESKLRLLYRTNDTDGLLSFTSNYLVNLPYHMKLTRARSRALQDQGRMSDALALIEVTLEVHPEAAALHADRGSVLLTLNRWEEATATFRRARQLDPNFSPAWYGELVGLLRGPWPAAQALLEAYVQRDKFVPDLDPAIVMLLGSATPRESWSSAIPWVLHIAGESPTSLLAAVAAHTLARLGELGQALRYLGLVAADEALATEHLDALRNDAMRLTAAGHAKVTLDVLRGSPAAPRLEPLLVALADMAGEHLHAPLEVREVAKHVRTRIELLAETGDIWNTDPLSLPIIRPRPASPAAPAQPGTAAPLPRAPGPGSG
ncbi:MAG: AAA family ATPase [Alphaproteobacteria bacterium]|nr:AAA family ATPase [Alphaproteobacteria bacterium]